MIDRVRTFLGVLGEAVRLVWRAWVLRPENVLDYGLRRALAIQLERDQDQLRASLYGREGVV